MATLTFTGTGGVWEGSAGAADVVINQDPCLIFDGDNDVVIDAGGQETLWQDSFSVSLWYRANAHAEHRIGFAKGASWDDYILIRIYVNGNVNGEYKSDGNGAETVTTSGPMDAPIVIGKWTHIAMTAEEGELDGLKLYINGVLADDADTTGITFANADISGDIRIGDMDASYKMDGSVMDVRFYDDILTGPEVQTLASKINIDSALGPGAANLQAWWKLNGAEVGSDAESGSGYIADSSRAQPSTTNLATLTNFTGTYWDYDAFSVNVQDTATTTGTTTVTQGKLEGLSLSSVDFDGTADYITCGDTADYTDAITVSCWAKIDDITPDRRPDTDRLETSGHRHATECRLGAVTNRNRTGDRLGSCRAE